MKARALLLLCAVLVAGCSDLLDPHAASGLAFTCMFLDAEDEPFATIDGYGAPDGAALEALAFALEAATPRPALSVRIRDDPVPDPLDADEVREWVDDHPSTAGRGIHLQVLWVGRVGEEGETGRVVAPGTVAISREAVQAAAVAHGVPVASMAVAVLLHHTGHALGLVNMGTPIASPDPSREGHPGHAADPTSIMHESWDRAGTVVWREDPAYSSEDARDWQALLAGSCQA